MRTSSGCPRRTFDPAEARRVLETDGCVILTGLGRSPEDAVAVAHSVFGADVLQVPEPSEVRAGGAKDRRPTDLDHSAPLPSHTDGFSYGDRYPDYFVLLCGQSSPVGGESFLVDGYDVVERLGTTKEGSELVERMQSTPVDQTEPDMHRSVSPILGYTPGGRMMLRLFPFQRPSDESTDTAADQQMIDAWREAIVSEAAAAPRFKLAPGEAAIIDNYRMMHGREAYSDLDRLMWRVWVWTTSAFGVPDGKLHSDSRYAITS